VQTSAKVNLIQIGSWDPDDFQKFPIQRYIYDNIFTKINHFFQKYAPCGAYFWKKNWLDLREAVIIDVSLDVEFLEVIWIQAMDVNSNVDESFKTFLHPNPEADDFQNLISSFSSTDTSLVKFSSVVFTWSC